MLNINNTTFEYNTANYGGAVEVNYDVATFTIEGKNTFNNNHAFIDGGAIYSNAKIKPMNNVTMNNNSAESSGGAIYYNNEEELNINNGNFNNNEATDGGAIKIALDETVCTIGGITTFVGNIASNDGGAIYVSKAGLANLIINANVHFINNKAATGYATRLAEDDLMYAENVYATTWSSPFVQGYNNYDISYYRNGEEPEACSAVGYQTIDVCVPVTVKPIAVVKSITTKCCGKAEVTPGPCDETINKECIFSIHQKMCTEVAVEFKADATTGEVNVLCDETSSENLCKNCND
jgi:predicted outer membrane repeat protein